MDNPPSAYPEPEQSSQVQEPEMPYSYPHAAGFPQPGYPPTQQMYTEPAQIHYPDVQQADYASYPDVQQPGYARLRKGWNSLGIALTALLLLLLVAGGSVYYYFQVRSTPEKTLQAFCSAIKNDNGQALYNTYSSAAQNQTDAPHLQQGLRLIEFLSGGIEDCVVDTSSIQENDPQATARVTFTLNSGHLSNAMLHLIEENGQWKVENNAIFP